MNQQIIIRRLSLVKSLYQIAVDQSKYPESLSFVSILTFHDALDMFMQLAAEKEGVPKKEKMFLVDFFQVLTNVTLGASVKKINQRRNAIKHSGIIPAKTEIEETATVAKLFFEENAKIVFNLEFESISLMELVTEERVRLLLLDGEKAFLSADYNLAADYAARAFFVILRTHENNKDLSEVERFFNKDITTDLRFSRSLAIAFPKMELHNKKMVIDYDVQLSNFVQNSNRNFERITEALMIVSIGVSYRKYIRFIDITPFVIVDRSSGKEEMKSAKKPGQPEMDKESAKFAIDFVLDVALKIQQFSTK